MPHLQTPSQTDTGSDHAGDACDEDDDNDGRADGDDNCPTVSNNDQADFDTDGVGDVCDTDADNDGAPTLPCDDFNTSVGSSLRMGWVYQARWIVMTAMQAIQQRSQPMRTPRWRPDHG